MRRVLSYLLNILIILYAVYDVLSSAIAGNTGTQRTIVYYLLFAMILIMIASILVHRYVKVDRIIIAFCLYCAYYSLDCFVIKRDYSWETIVYFVLLIWWIVTQLYFKGEQERVETTYLTYKYFARVMFVFYFVAIIYSSYNISNVFSTVEYARVGYVFHVLSLLPLLLLEQNNKSTMIVFIMASFAAIFSFKRSAIIMLPLLIITFLLVSNRIKHKKSNVLIIGAIVVLFFLVWKGMNYYSEGYLSQRFSWAELISGSGRIDIIHNLINIIANRSLVQNIFGIPANNEHILTVGAHNEWINQLYMCGIIGMVFYAIIMINLIIISFRLMKRRSVLAASFCSMTVYSIGIGMGSGWIFMHSSFYIMIYLGLVSSLKKLEKDELLKVLNRRGGKG